MLLDNKPKEYTLVKDVLSACIQVTKQLKLYGVANRQVGLGLNRLEGYLQSYFQYHNSLEITVARHGFLYNDDFVERKNKLFEDFAYSLFQHGISAIRVLKDLSVNDLQTFLTLSARPASETWEEGGFSASLQMRGVSNIAVREMSEKDIDYLDGVTDDSESLLREKSPIWDRFAFAVYKGLTKADDTAEATEENTSPSFLAELTNKALSKMSAASQQNFSKGLSSFLSSIQFEKINRYRKKALAKLTEFINRMTPELRERLFVNIFNTNLKPSFAEEFFSGLSDEIIVELLANSADAKDYAPPVIMKVLGKIAQEKSLDIKQKKSTDQELAIKKNEVEKLFQKDDFEKYVPEDYRDALLNIIQHENLSGESNDNLANLKTTLLDTHQEKHTTEIIVKVLTESPDQAYLQGLGDNLVNIIYLYIEDGDFAALNDLCTLLQQKSLEKADFSRFHQVLTSDDVINKIIQSIALYGKSRYEDIETLTLTIGHPFVPHLVTAIAKDPNRSHRLLYLKLVQQLDPEVVFQETIKHLDDSRWFFVRNLILILKGTRNKEAIPFLKPLSSHPHPKVRSEVLRTCLYFGCDDAIQRLLQMLNDKDANTVDMAISLAVMTRNSDVALRLIEILGENPVLNYRLDQKISIVKTLHESVPKGSMPAFFDLLAKRNTLHPKQYKQLQLETIKILGKYDPAILLPALKKNLPSMSGDIKRQLLQLQQKMERS